MTDLGVTNAVPTKVGARTTEVALHLGVSVGKASRLLNEASDRRLIQAVPDRAKPFRQGVRWYRWGDVPLEHAAFVALPAEAFRHG